MKKVYTDVAVIGAGSAGLVAFRNRSVSADTRIDDNE